MKKSLVLFGLVASISFQAQAVEMCDVQVCNKIERMSLDIFSHIKDSIGEQCFHITMPKEDAVVGKTLSSDSRWYQGEFNPTKKSVTKIKSVGECKTVEYK